jgi:hypothetical protein
MLNVCMTVVELSLNLTAGGYRVVSGTTGMTDGYGSPSADASNFPSICGRAVCSSHGLIWSYSDTAKPCVGRRCRAAL